MVNKKEARMNTIAVFIPTYRRHQKLLSLAYSIAHSSAIPFTLYFIIEKHDRQTLNVLMRNKLKYIVNKGGPTYASCINTAYKETKEDIFFLGADDLSFHNGWIENALPLLRKYYVVGTNDLHNKYVINGQLATHFFVKRNYIEKYSGCVDEPNIVLHEYSHYCVDTECVSTAKARGVFSPCLNSIVEHKHWEDNNAKIDETYLRAMKNYLTDYRCYLKRTHLWYCIGQENIFKRSTMHAYLTILNIARWLWFIPLYYRSMFILYSHRAYQQL